MSPRPRRNERQANLQEAIKETAWKQIGEFGAQALSLRAIGRSLRITAPAIYNYFPDRDALVTVLIIDAFNSFGQALEAARDALPKEDLAGRFSTSSAGCGRGWIPNQPGSAPSARSGRDARARDPNTSVPGRGAAAPQRSRRLARAREGSGRRSIGHTTIEHLF